MALLWQLVNWHSAKEPWSRLVSSAAGLVLARLGRCSPCTSNVPMTRYNQLPQIGRVLIKDASAALMHLDHTHHNYVPL